jgi:ABC-type glycerol-3-phosphate transport system substrate-binding protein
MNMWGFTNSILQEIKGRFPAFLEEGQQFIREGTYCFPLMKSTEVMFYNKEQVDTLLPLYDATLNTEAARTRFLNNMSWDQFLDVCEAAIEHKSSLISTLDRPAYYDSDSNLFISKMFQNEIPYSSINPETQKGQIDFETGQANADAKAMVASIKEAYDKGLITTKGCEGTYGSDAFTAEESLFSIGSSGGAGYNFPDSDNFTVGVCKVPASNNNPLYVSQGPSLCMLKNTSLSDSVNRDSLEYAWKFVKFLTNTENNIELCIVGSEGYVPVRESSYETELYFDFLLNGENYAAVANVVVDDISGNYLSAAVFTGSDRLRDQVGGIISSVLLNMSTIDKAFADAINNTKLFIK